MPLIKNRGLRGLPGLNNLSERERSAFMLANSAILDKFNNPASMEKAAEILYNNQQFVNRFGQDAFNKMNDGTELGYNRRNELLRDAAVNEAIDRAFKPTVNKGRIDEMTGAGSFYNKIMELPTDAKEELLRSDWLTPAEFEKENSHDTLSKVLGVGYKIGDFITTLPTAAAKLALGDDFGKYLEALDIRKNAVDMVMNGWKQYNKEKNDKILENIYNNAADKAADANAAAVSQAYLNPQITGIDDEDTKRKFLREITPGSYDGNMGISEYAAHYGTGSEDDLDRGDMDEFSIDDMRQVLAKKYVYERTMSPQLANTALNNEAKRYIKDHQSGLETFGLFAKDVGIASMSYTADKINSLYNLALWAQDSMGNTPTVYVDDTGKILDPSKKEIKKAGNGNMSYLGDDGKEHAVHLEQVDRRTLHNMGKNEDGSDADEGIFHLNPQYWTRAEQFGTLDADEQKQYEKLGSSPYKVMYDPNDERDLVYESFKMMSFGIADIAAQLIPYGVGTAGKVLSTANKVGKVAQGFGKGLEFVGKGLSSETKFGQVAQGLLGAGGIGYAYQRGSFQETLAQNLANLDEANIHKAQQSVYDRYDRDKAFRADVDTMINEKASEIAPEYIKQMQEQGLPINEQDAADKIIEKAKDSVFSNLVQQQASEYKGTKEYADMQQEAIQSAGDAAFRTFLPEAIKYGLVNTMGYRKFLYTNPMGLKKSVSGAFKGMEEITTQEGKRRMVAGAGKTPWYVPKGAEAAWNSKAGRIGRVVGSQFWGGAWTNGTDDMMVDAAERINEDSFNRYLKAYENGEALADEYGLIDGIYSYWKGLGNSLGQQTTREAAAVGGFGSLVSASPHFVNMASLATKEGREQFEKQFGKRVVYEEDEKGFKKPKLDDKGNIVTEDVGWGDNFMERMSFFIQNGVLNNYYGKKQGERALQEHADYINNFLDDQNDFDALKDLITADRERQIAYLRTDDEDNSKADQHTMRFIHAFEAMAALDRLKKDKKDPVFMSSVVDDAMRLIDNASKIDSEESTLSTRQLKDLIDTYHSNNPEFGRSEEHDKIALQNIADNAKKMMEAYNAYNDAEKHLSDIEKNKGISIVPAVRSSIKLHKALDGHWSGRIDAMKDEIGDTTNEESKTKGTALVASYGNKETAQKKLGSIEGAIEYGHKELGKAIAIVEKKLDVYNEAQQRYKEAKTGDEKFKIAKEVIKTKQEYEDAVENKNAIEDQLELIRERRDSLKEALAEAEEVPTLSADEIFALDPITRARMMDKKNRTNYTEEQRKQIEELEGRLTKDKSDTGDPLKKIQDIALLTQLRAKSRDAYNRLTRNPDAAALRFEMLGKQEAEAARKLIDRRNAKSLANTAESIENSLRVRNVPEDQIKSVIYRLLRKHSPTILDYIESENMLPNHSEHLTRAKAWGNVVEDLDAVISAADESTEWKEKMRNNVDAIIDVAEDDKGIIDALGNAVKAGHSDADDIAKILKGLDEQKYQRAAVVLQEAEEKKKAEEIVKEKLEREKKKAEEAKKAADEEAKKEEEKKEGSKKEEEKKEGTSEEEKIENIFGESVEEEEEDNKIHVRKPSYHSSMKEQIGNKKSKWEYYTEGKRNTRDTDKGKVILGVAYPSTVKPAIDYAIDAGLLDDSYKLSDEIGIENSDKARVAIERLKELGIETPKDLIKFVEENDGKDIDIDNKPEESSVIEEEKVFTAGHDDVTGDYVEGQSQSLEDQLSAKGINAEDMSKETDDLDALNDELINKEEKKDTGEEPFVALSGNPMCPFIIKAQKDANDNWIYGGDGRSLSKDRVLIHKRGASPNDSMNNYFSWMEAAGIKLQNIINYELPEILKKNPHTKIRFMVVRSQKNATHDDYMHNNETNHLLLVVDYDNSINPGITSIHNEENGGVITSGGKKYLVVGGLGYGKHKSGRRFDMWKTLNDPHSESSLNMRKRSWKWFDKTNSKGEKVNAAERFYVDPDYYTEIVPNSMIPGWLVNQLEQDKEAPKRSIGSLLEDANEEGRNPNHLTWGTLAWTIVEHSKYADINLRGRKAMHPQNKEQNVGRVFVLVPAGNGKLVPIRIEPLRYMEKGYNENSALNQEIQQTLRRLTASTLEERKAAVVELLKVFHIDPENGHNILVGKDSDGTPNAITLIRMRDGVEEYKKTIFTRDNVNARTEVLDAVKEWQPRINITVNVLQNPDLLKKYDEIGALMVDVAKLGTDGVGYEVYGLDNIGEMIKPKEDKYKPARRARDTQHEDPYRSIVYVGNNKYQYNKETGKYMSDGVELKDNDPIIKELEYARRILEGGITAVKNDKNWAYYILGTGDNAEVVRRNVNTSRYESVSEEQAKKIIEEEQERLAQEEREKNIERKKEEEERENKEENVTVDEETGEIVTLKRDEENAEENEVNSKDGETETLEKKKEEKPVIPAPSSNPTTKPFIKAVSSGRKTVNRINKAMEEKWGRKFSGNKERLQFLKDKGVPQEALDNVPTDDIGLEAWIHKNIECL